MLLKQYLQLRNGSNAKNISVAECKALGIPVIMESGWIKPYLSMDIPETVVQGLAKMVISANWSKQRIKRNLSQLITTPVEPFSNYKWAKVRGDFLAGAVEKKCSECESTTNLEVDHILPKSVFPELAYSKKNLQILCASCNNRKSNYVDTTKLEAFFAGEFND